MAARLPVNPLIVRTLSLAINKLGIEEVARRIGEPELLLQTWREGHATIPRDKFLMLVDILLDLGVGWDEWDNEKSL